MEDVIVCRKPEIIAARLADTDLNTLIFYSGNSDVMFEYVDKGTRLPGRIPADDPAELMRSYNSMDPKDREKAVALLDFPRTEMEPFMAEKWTGNFPKQFLGFNLNTEAGLCGIIQKIEHARHTLGEPVLFDVVYKYLVARAMVKFPWVEKKYRALGFFETLSREQLVERLARGWEDRPALYLLERNIPTAPNGNGAGLREKLMSDMSELTADEPRYFEGSVAHLPDWEADGDLRFDLNTPDGIEKAMDFLSYGDLNIDFYEYLIARSIVKFPWTGKGLRKIWSFNGISREELAEWLKNGWDNRPEICRLEKMDLKDLCFLSGLEHVFLDYPDPHGKGRNRVSFANREALSDILHDHHYALKRLVDMEDRNAEF